MLAVYMAPFYVLINIGLLVLLMMWLRSWGDFFRKWWVTAIISVVFMFCALSIGIAFLMPVCFMQKILKYFGNIWLGFMCFALLILIPLTAIQGIIHLVKKGKGVSFRTVCRNFRKTTLYRVLGLLTVVAIVGITGYGVYHGHDIQYNDYDVTIDKDGGKLDELKIALVADMHMGYNVGCSHIQQMVDKINAQNPDIILIAGDIFDNEIQALDDPDRLAEILSGLQSKYGTYAVYGNHDIQEKILAGFTFPSNEKKEADPGMDELLEKANITMLRDEAVLIDDSFYIYGRPDEERPGKDIEVRKTAAELMETMDSTKPIIVLDHEPKELEEIADAGVDLFLNGHVHDGQIFPGNIVMKFLWENPCGYLKIGNMQNIVTSGVGVWGPALRVGTDSEICNITVHFQ